ncbi:EF hand family protein [Tritrichomonas foetus]|uniref:EF hand family protein n=1 Tax=Tritrichomonas foetus TaxID=1144522 RepID=A0A1J4K8R9_9EUKA|nr:EF hand family protein [Tritrichomonas foetus]|eukprot:OHT06070.1 EF hand family protein [Tritrichomonas foetus]
MNSKKKKKKSYSKNSKWKKNVKKRRLFEWITKSLSNNQMFDPNFFTDEQYVEYTNAFVKRAKGRGKGYLNKETMRKAIIACRLIPAPSEKDLDAMCTSDHVDIEQFFIIIFWYLRGIGTRAELIHAFQQIDIDNDGKIPFSEIRAILEMRPHSFSNEQILTLRKELNCFEDDLVDYTLFVNKIRPR